MKKLMMALAGLAALGLPAEAQSYRCENGELMGGPAGTFAKCSTNAYGQITNVRPYSPGSASRQTTRIYPNAQSPSRGTTQVYRGGQRTSVQHSAPRYRSAAPAPLRSHQSHSRTTVTQPVYTRPAMTHSSAPVRYSAPVQRQPYQPTRVVRTAPPQPQISRKAVTATSRYGHRGSGVCKKKIKRIPTRGDITAYEVCYEDLVPVYGKRTKKLYHRIEHASEKACGFDNHSFVSRWYSRRSDCVGDSVYRAVMETGIPELRQYYFAKTGKGVPRATVGPLRRY